MADQLEWIEIRGLGNRSLGAIGFIGNDAVAVAAFFDDLDGNQDGKVSFGERVVGFLSPVSLEGKAVTEVAMAARLNTEIIMRDASFAQMAGQMFTRFAAGLVRDGIWAVYFKPGVSMTAKGVARRITSGMVKQLVIRKGFEKAAREAFNQATGV